MIAEEDLSHTLNLKDARIHYLASGDPQDLNVLFLHGARFSAKDWLSVGSLKFLAEKGYGAFALDLPGYGKSEKIPLSPQQFLEEISKEMGLKQWVLVGPSMGGQIALQCALSGLKGLVALALFAPVGLPSLKGRLREIEIPILLMWGDRDQVVSPSHADILLKENSMIRFVLIKGEGHTGYFNRPGQFNRALGDFLDHIGEIKGEPLIQ